MKERYEHRTFVSMIGEGICCLQFGILFDLKWTAVYCDGSLSLFQKIELLELYLSILELVAN